ncbi:mediator of RNA polymerase II transcription subunit 4 [Parasteatoda tepidariorum]|uniref:mediator of RNA polymerase II transcription subunit 4 n=1 Tax=Parasteatoda tepidariorum TaxID=114398 RepID=UPI00077F929A|nr:mediator of RNA polymerase II transcription subunit 4 [Parasteatoda tepidariorum]
MSTVGTRDILLGLIDDIELIAKELFESLIAPKGQRLSPSELGQLAELLVMKDQELKAALVTAAEQSEIQKKIDALQVEVEKQDNDIQHLQKYLKEAEHLLATAVYQAKQKLQCHAKSSEKSVSLEELIKYAHKISCSYAVAAPHNWQPGDPRRPYPTDIEMRLGFLGRLSDLPISGSMLQQQQGGLDMGVRGPHGEQNPGSQAGTFTWSASTDLKNSMSSSSAHGVSMDTKSHNKENEDVEVMSTDSSSSSSSDSQ